jgi:hypothetical protein
MVSSRQALTLASVPGHVLKADLFPFYNAIGVAYPQPSIRQPTVLIKF